MKLYEDFEIDYEQMDDLPLSEHIDWQHIASDKEISAGINTDKPEILLDIDFDRFQNSNTVQDELIEHTHFDPTPNPT